MQWLGESRRNATAASTRQKEEELEKKIKKQPTYVDRRTRTQQNPTTPRRGVLSR
jgi:hypothetical protein